MGNLGIYVKESDGKCSLMFNGQLITEVRSPRNKFGLVVDGQKLILQGIDVAYSAQTNPLIQQVGSAVFFGEVPLLSNGKCINITKEDYSRLCAGEAVQGYVRYNPFDIYNIVPDVSVASTVTYTVSNGIVTFSDDSTSEMSNDMLYNNSDGVLTHNNESMSATVENTDTPFLCLRYFNPIIPVGGKVSFTYHVDTIDMAKVNYDTLDRTFTIVVETESGTTVKKTTYAGVFEFSTSAFSSAGETWFSVRCIDSRGVSSPVQYYDILVRNEVSFNTYTMTESDLEEFTHDGETYRIVPDNSSVSVALANKAALSAFFAKVKASGYNKVVMLNRTYWVDYHDAEMNAVNGGDPIIFPDEFTVDLNGATIAVTQCDDLDSGNVVVLYRNYDTHIMNGHIKGNYDGFDFAATSANTGGAIGEHLNVISSVGSKYCSFENLDVSHSVGYDGVFRSIYATTYLTPSFSVGGINPSTGEVDVTKTNMVVSNLMTINEHYLSLGEVALGKFGLGGYWAGDKRDYFMSFYNSEDVHIKTIKSKMYYSVKIPAGAAKIRVSGYGTTSQWEVNAGNGPFIVLHERSKNIVVKHCSWHNTRSCAITAEHVKGLLYDNCTFKDIAQETGTYQATRLLGDFEDGWQWLCDVCFKHCKCIKGGGSNILKVMYCNNFDFADNSDISLWFEYGGVESGFVRNNTLPLADIGRGFRSYHPNVLFDGNHIGTLTVNDQGNVVEPLTMVNTVIENRCSYTNLHIRNSVNGGEYIE